MIKRLTRTRPGRRNPYDGPVPTPAPGPASSPMPAPAPVPGPTLADIARAAEVSTATVSHALNGTGRLGESTRRRVREVAGALGYGARRDPHNRSIGLAVTTYAGFAWDFARIAYFSRLLIAATSAAHAHGYALTTLPADRGAEPLWHTLAVDGLLLLDSPADDPVLRALRARGLPVVFDGPPSISARGRVGGQRPHRHHPRGAGPPRGLRCPADRAARWLRPRVLHRGCHVSL